MWKWSKRTNINIIGGNFNFCPRNVTAVVCYLVANKRPRIKYLTIILRGRQNSQYFRSLAIPTPIRNSHKSIVVTRLNIKPTSFALLNHIICKERENFWVYISVCGSTNWNGKSSLNSINTSMWIIQKNSARPCITIICSKNRTPIEYLLNMSNEYFCTGKKIIRYSIVFVKGAVGNTKFISLSTHLFD